MLVAQLKKGKVMPNYIKAWEDAKAEVKNAEYWQGLPGGPKYQNDRFDIGSSHGTMPVFVRHGQQTSGGNNYWNSPAALNKAIYDVIVSDFQQIYDKALARMHKKELDALLDCQKHIDKMQSLISEASQYERT